MKVLQIIDTLDVGGAEKIVVMLSNLLHNNGHEVSVLVLTRKGELAAELDLAIEVIQLKRTKRFDSKKMKELAVVMSNFEIVHTHLKHNYRYTALVKKRFGVMGPKIVFHDHSHNLGVPKLSTKYAKDWLFKNMLKPAHYIGVSLENCSWANTYLGLDRKSCYLLENVVAQERISEKKEEKKGLVLVSNFTRIKNMEFAVQLAKSLKEPLTIYGRINDEIYFNELTDYISQQNMSTQVTFVHNCRNVQKELFRYKCGIHTSYKETGPLVLIEFMAQNLPFVSHATGAVCNKMKPLLPLSFIEGFDKEQWLKNISEVQNTEGSTLQKLYLEHYSTQNYYDQCLVIYRSILNS